MEDLNGRDRDLAALTVLAVGAVVASEDRWLPFDLVDQSSIRVEPVAEFLRDLQACGRSPATARSYAMDLLRWFRFLWALGLDWNRASRAEARDFCRWMLLVRRPGRADCGLAPSVRAHAETVLRGFYDFHLQAGTGPILNPFPLDRARRAPAPMPITIRWSRIEMRSLAGFDPPSRPRSLAACRTQNLTRSSPGWDRIVTGPWLPSMSPPVRGRRSCCR